MKPDTQGIWCKKTNKWYYLEVGIHKSTRSLERLKTILLSRGYAEYEIDGIKRGAEPMRVMTYRDAKEKNYEVEVLYLNNFVKSQVEASPKPESKSPWADD